MKASKPRWEPPRLNSRNTNLREWQHNKDDSWIIREVIFPFSSYDKYARLKFDPKRVYTRAFVIDLLARMDKVGYTKLLLIGIPKYLISIFDDVIAHSKIDGSMIRYDKDTVTV